MKKTNKKFPKIVVSFFNDTKKNIRIRTTPCSDLRNPEYIRRLEAQNIYIKSGFLKIWDCDTEFVLLVE